MTNTEINVLEKELDFASIQNKINEPERRKNFEEFCRTMKTKWSFRNNISKNFNENLRTLPLHLSPNGSQLMVILA